MFRVRLIVVLLIISANCAIGMEQKGEEEKRTEDYRSYNCPRPCAMGCRIGCKALSWVSWCSGICCWLPTIFGEMPTITRQAMNLSRVTGNAADYFKVSAELGLDKDKPV